MTHRVFSLSTYVIYQIYSSYKSSLIQRLKTWIDNHVAELNCFQGMVSIYDNTVTCVANVQVRIWYYVVVIYLSEG